MKEKVSEAEMIRRLKEATEDEDKYFPGVLGNPVTFAGRGLFYGKYQEQGAGAKKIFLGTQFEQPTLDDSFPAGMNRLFARVSSLPLSFLKIGWRFRTCPLPLKRKSAAVGK